MANKHICIKNRVSVTEGEDLETRVGRGDREEGWGGAVRAALVCRRPMGAVMASPAQWVLAPWLAESAAKAVGSGISCGFFTLVGRPGPIIL